MQTSKSDYSTKTQFSRDPLRKFSHGKRFNVALSLIDLPDNAHVLDFGGGDGAFLKLLMNHSQRNFDAVLFEPYMPVERNDTFSIASTWDGVVEAAKKQLFDLVICQEVMEHFAPNRQDEALRRIASVMGPQASLLLSVPVEMGPVALVKNIGRWKYRRNGNHIYNYRNLLRSVFALPIPDARAGDEYLSHMGFYFTDFREVLSRHFVIDAMVGSPFSNMPLIMNSQVFFRARSRIPS